MDEHSINDSSNNNPQVDSSMSWSASIVFAVINLILIIICNLFKKMVLSTGVILLFLLGIYAGYSAIKCGKNEGKISSIFLGIIGIIVNVMIIVLYVVLILKKYI